MSHPINRNCSLLSHSELVLLANIVMQEGDEDEEDDDEDDDDDENVSFTS